VQDFDTVELPSWYPREERERERESEEETLTRVEPNGADTLDLPHERGQADVPHRPRPLVLRGDGSA
jgi:hypothetical protein